MVPAGVTGGRWGFGSGAACWGRYGDSCYFYRRENEGRRRARKEQNEGGDGGNKEEWKKEAFKEFAVPYASRPSSVSLN